MREGRKRAIEILTPKTKEEFLKMRPLEMCTCGHFRSEHGDVMLKKIMIAEGHGKCMYGKMSIFCSCEKFTWNGKWSQ